METKSLMCGEVAGKFTEIRSYVDIIDIRFEQFVV